MHNKPHSKDAKLKMSAAHKGRPLPETTKANMRIAVKKRHESGEKFGFQKGHTFWLGKKRTAETIEKMRINKRGTYMGEKHWNWKGGITKAREWLRKLFEYRQWRADVFTRDNYACQICFKRGGNLEADHYPKMFSQILDEQKITTRAQARACEELWNINNGRTLCEECHFRTYKGVPKKPWK